MSTRQSRVEKNTSSQGVHMPITVSATMMYPICLQVPNEEEQKQVWELHVYMCF